MSKVVQVGVDNWKKSNRARWITCHACAQVTAGKVRSEYLPQNKMTQDEYGRKLGVTRQQVSRLSNAWRMYATMRLAWLWWPNLSAIYPHPFEVRTADAITTEHFTELWEVYHKYKLPLADCFDYLCWAWDGAVSAEVMRHFIDDAHDGKSDIPEWFTHGSAAMALLGKLQGDFGAPDEVKLLASMTYEALKEWMEYGVATGE